MPFYKPDEDIILLQRLTTKREGTYAATTNKLKEGGMISKILVTTDGSKTAQKAAMQGVDLAKQLQASVIVLSVIDQRSFK